jgi:hypothetical protein
MMRGDLNDLQSRALAALMASLHPGWDVPGIAAAIHKAKRRAPAHEVMIAGIRFAMRDELRTPTLLAEDGPHWVGLPVAESRAPKPPMCPEHHEPIRAIDGTCRGCRADELIDTLPAPVVAPSVARTDWAAVSTEGAAKCRAVLSGTPKRVEES